MSEFRIDESVITFEDIREWFTYSKTSGVFKWRKSPSRAIRAGQVAGSVNAHGYIHLKLRGVRVFAHRAAWLYVTGRWPTGQIDHRNRVRSDNRFKNLRVVQPFGNAVNRESGKTTASGLPGVYKSRKRWRSSFMRDGVRIELGIFDTPERAHEVHCAAVAAYGGLFVGDVHD